MKSSSTTATYLFVVFINLSACGGGGGSTPAPPTPVTLQSIAVTPDSPSLSVGAQQTLTATGTYSDHTTKVLTAMATWSSDAASIAKVIGGTVIGVSSGSTTIVATYGGVSGSDKVTVPSSTWVSAATAPFLVSGPTATLLSDGKVLVDGGDPYQSPPGAAVYDPVANSWSPTGPTATSRYGATATLLQDGRVLVAGGNVINTAAPIGANPTLYLASAELYDPSTNEWSDAATLPGPRELQAAALLPDGKVLLVGGDDGQQPLTDALLYDPMANTWTSIPTALTIGTLPTATLLQSGKVLVTVTSMSGAYSQIFDPSANTWSNGPNMNNPHLLGATATLLSDGRVIVIGGSTSINQGSSMAVPEIYDPTAGSWSLAGTMGTSRVEHTATLLLSGKVLVAGGSVYYGPSLSTTELYDPSTNSWSTGASLATPRDHHGAVLLQPGQVFVTGGQNQSAALLTSELYR